ncbi:MAG: type II toxin-antitoxin system HicA family toxin [Gemmatimonadales bacterium]
MGRHEHLLSRIRDGRARANIAFVDLQALLLHLGFRERQRRSHHIFTRSDIVERINLQPRGAAAKPHQVR